MLLSSNGIVLNSLNYGDNSLISKVFSKDQGLITVISNKKKGKRKGQSNYFQPLNAIQFVCYWTPKKEIHRIKDISFNTSINTPKESVSANAIRFFLAEFLCKIIKEQEQNLSLYQFFESRINLLNKEGGDLSSFHLSFLLDLLFLFGIQPDIDPSDSYFDLNEGHSVSVRPIHADYYEANDLGLLKKAFDKKVNFSKKERQRLLNLIINYYNIQLGGGLENLKSKSVLEVIFS